MIAINGNIVEVLGERFECTTAQLFVVKKLKSDYEARGFLRKRAMRVENAVEAVASDKELREWSNKIIEELRK